MAGYFNRVGSFFEFYANKLCVVDLTGLVGWRGDCGCLKSFAGFIFSLKTLKCFLFTYYLHCSRVYKIPFVPISKRKLRYKWSGAFVGRKSVCDNKFSFFCRTLVGPSLWHAKNIKKTAIFYYLFRESYWYNMIGDVLLWHKAVI